MAYGIPEDELRRVQASIKEFLSEWYVRLGVGSGHRVLIPCGDVRVIEFMLRDECNVTYIESESGELDDVRQSTTERSVNVVQAELSSLPWPDSSFDRILLCFGMHELRGNVECTLNELARVTVGGGTMLVIDKVDLGLHEPSLEEEAECLLTDIQQTRGSAVLGIQTTEGYHEILSTGGWNVIEQRIWGMVVQVHATSTADLGLDVLEREVELVSDVGIRSKFRDRLTRLAERAYGRPALAGRWAAIVGKS